MGQEREEGRKEGIGGVVGAMMRRGGRSVRQREDGKGYIRDGKILYSRWERR